MASKHAEELQRQIDTQFDFMDREPDDTETLELIDRAIQSAVAEACADYEEMEKRFSALLCELTNGRLSKTNYPQGVMLGAIADVAHQETQKLIADEVKAACAERDALIRDAKTALPITAADMPLRLAVYCAIFGSARYFSSNGPNQLEWNFVDAVIAAEKETRK